MNQQYLTMATFEPPLSPDNRGHLQQNHLQHPFQETHRHHGPSHQRQPLPLPITRKGKGPGGHQTIRKNQNILLLQKLPQPHQKTLPRKE